MKKNTKPLISVIIPVYNVKDYLERCVDSLINQTYSKIEILLIDDGSTDESGALCDKLLEKDSRIKVYHKKNGGLSDARNYGLGKAHGEYVVFIDSDDDVTNNCIKKLYGLINKHDTKMSICAYSIVSKNRATNIGNNYKEEVLNTEECLSRMLQEEGFTVSACGKMFHKSLFKNIEFPKGKLYEDNGTMYKLIMLCDNISYSNESVYNYYIRSNSITNEKYSKRKLDYILLTDQATKDILKVYPNLKDECEARKVVSRFCVLRQMLNTKLSDEDELEENKIISYFKENKTNILKNNCVSTKNKISLRALMISKKLLKMGANLYERLK